MKFEFGRSIVATVVMTMSVFTVAGELEIKASLAKSIPSLKVTKVEKSEIEGLYQVQSEGGQLLFSNADASFFLTGDMYSTASGQLVNLTEVSRGNDRAAKISAIKPSDKIVFPAKGDVKAKIAVFTDIDCGYCRKLHNEVPRMNELGIEVSYLAYPRAGIGSNSYKKIVSAWCSEDRLNAMTNAKSGKAIPELSCDNPVASQFELGQELGVTGTPAILLEDGTLVPGYMPADKLARALGVL